MGYGPGLTGHTDTSGHTAGGRRGGGRCGRGRRWSWSSVPWLAVPWLAVPSWALRSWCRFGHRRDTAGCRWSQAGSPAGSAASGRAGASAARARHRLRSFRRASASRCGAAAGLSVGSGCGMATGVFTGEIDDGVLRATEVEVTFDRAGNAHAGSYPSCRNRSRRRPWPSPRAGHRDHRQAHEDASGSRQRRLDVPHRRARRRYRSRRRCRTTRCRDR